MWICLPKQGDTYVIIVSENRRLKDVKTVGSKLHFRIFKCLAIWSNIIITCPNSIHLPVKITPLRSETCSLLHWVVALGSTCSFYVSGFIVLHLKWIIVEVFWKRLLWNATKRVSTKGKSRCFTSRNFLSKLTEINAIQCRSVWRTGTFTM